MKYFLSLCLLLLSSFFLSGDDHKFYVSTTIIEQNTITNSLEITIKLFTDDLEQALEKSSESPMCLGDEREYKEADRLIEEYLREKLELSFNDRPVYPNFIGKEVEYDLTFVYFELLSIPEFDVLTLRDEIFFELFEEQVNIIHLKLDGWEQTLMLDKREPMRVINR